VAGGPPLTIALGQRGSGSVIELKDSTHGSTERRTNKGRENQRNFRAVPPCHEKEKKEKDTGAGGRE